MLDRQNHLISKDNFNKDMKVVTCVENFEPNIYCDRQKTH